MAWERGPLDVACAEPSLACKGAPLFKKFVKLHICTFLAIKMHKLVCFSLDFSKKGAKFVSVLTYLGVLGPAKTPSFDSKTLLLGAKPVVSEINPNLQSKVYLGGGSKTLMGH